MTKREMLEAVLAGEILVRTKNPDDKLIFDEQEGFIYHNGFEWQPAAVGVVNWEDWTIKEEPRYMTRDEVLGFLANTPGIVVRHKDNVMWRLPGRPIFDNPIEEYEYATIDCDGNYGEPQEFRR